MRPVIQLLILLAVLNSSGCSGARPIPVIIADPANAPTASPMLAPTATASAVISSPDIKPAEKTAAPHSSPIPPTDTASPVPIAPPTLSPDEWQNLPILPQPSSRIREIYQLGLELGNNPKAFSKVGDCGSTPAWFLGDFDHGRQYYDLGNNHELVPVIEAFQGSFARTSLAAKAGFNASSVFSLLWSDRQQCQPDETPLACEYRQQKPVIAFIMLGSNDVYHLDTFEAQMRNLIEYSINNGVIPILSTKADNLEGDHWINYTIARLALEYQIPLINYWRAVQALPKKGLQDDAVHITWGPNRFNDPQVMQAGWPVRNLTSLQALDIVWRAAVNLDTTPQP